MHTTFLTHITKTTHQIASAKLKRAVEIDIYQPDDLLGNACVNLLLLNDGQDVVQMNLEDLLGDLYAQGKIAPVIVVAIKASALRVDEYGTAAQTDYAGRGNKAKAYTGFIINELLSFVHQTIDLPITGKTAIAGFSLGGLTAFDIAWNKDNYFDIAGAFSGSFWWRKKDLKDGYTDNDRIMHEVVRNTARKPETKFWLMTGTEDETADRNHNGIIDSIDDTIDLIKEMRHKGFKKYDDVFYYEMVGGQHNIESWTKAMPAFLCWAFAR